MFTLVGLYAVEPVFSSCFLHFSASIGLLIAFSVTARSVVHNYKINRDYEITFPKFTPPVEKSTRARVPQTKISNAFKKCELVFVPLFADKRELVRLKNEGFNIGVEIPRGKVIS